MNRSNQTKVNNAMVAELFLEVLECVKKAYDEKLLSILGHQGTQDRLAKGIDILTKENMYEVKATSDTSIWIVVNKLNPEGSEYVVDLTEKTCTCPDAERGNICKHRLACEVLINAAEKWGKQSK